MLVSEFITAVRRQGKITTDTTDTEIMASGDMEIQGRLVPLLRLSRQEYFVTETQLSSIDGRVRLPSRAILGATRHVQLVTNGVATTLPRLEIEDDRLAGGGGVPAAWCIDQGAIILLPRGCDGTVRVRYFIRPSKMSSAGFPDSALVSSVVVSAASVEIFLASSSPTAGLLFDVVSGGSAGAICVLDAVSTEDLAEVIPRSSILSPMAVGDYVTLAGFTPVVPLPEELFSALVHQTAYVILRSLGYDSEAGAQKTLADDAMGVAQAILAPRTEGNPRRRRGGIRASIGRWGSGWLGGNR